MKWKLRDRILELNDRPLIMGIVNVTPDSFSDGGQFLSTERAIEHGLRLIEDGADILDIGGESTRPDADAVSLDEELTRVVPVIEGLLAHGPKDLIISIDTYKAEVARQAIEAGAIIFNDVTGLRPSFESKADAIDEQKLRVAQDYEPGVILMHSQGSPTTMQIDPHYENVVEEVYQFLETRCQVLLDQGIARETLSIDPGIGFGKTRENNWVLLRELGRLQNLGVPLCLGVSRKGFLGKALGRSVEDRMVGSVAVACYSRMQKSAQILRVHDVAETRDALTVLDALQKE